MCTANGLNSSFRQSKILDLTLLDQALHSPGNVFDRHGGIDPVLV